MNRMVHICLENIAKDWLCLLFVLCPNMTYPYDLPVKLCLSHYQYKCRVAYHPNKVHTHENHQLKYRLVRNSFHESFEIDFLTNLVPNEESTRMIKVLLQLILDIQRFLYFT